MRKVPVNLFGSSYKKDDVQNASSQNLINWYIEESPNGDTIMVLPTPGCAEWLDLSGSVVRGMHQHNDVGYVVVDNKVYSITKTKVYRLLGTLTTSTGRVCISSISDEVVFADGSKCWSYQITADNFSEITDVDLPTGVSIVVGISAYFLYIAPETQAVYVSELNDGRSILATALFQAEIDSDKVLSGYASNYLAYIFGSTSTEIWYPSGQQGGAPFDRYSRGALSYGIAAKHLAADAFGSMFWVATGKSGIIGLVRADENSIEVISNRAFVRQLNSYIDISDGFAWVDIYDSHVFFNMTFPSATESRGYTHSFDITTKTWLQRETYNPSNSFEPGYDRYLANCYMSLGNKQLIGDFQSGKIYEVSKSYGTDNTIPIRREGETVDFQDNHNMFSMSDLQVEVEDSIGLDGDAVPGSSPVLNMQVSSDHGRTYSQQMSRNGPAIGEYNKKLSWECGAGYSLRFKFSCSDPVNWALIRATATMEMGNG